MLTGSVPGDLESPWLLDDFEGATWGERDVLFRRFEHKEKVEVHSAPKLSHHCFVFLCWRKRCGIGH